MTTMQNMSCMMHTSASAACADAAASCAYTAGMQSASTNMMIMGATIMASIIIFRGLVNSLILASVHLFTLLVLVSVVVLLGVMIKGKYTSRP